MPGVVGVYTADDLDVPDYFLFININPQAPRPSLAKGTVRFVGEIVAVVVAESRAQAVDAAEAVVVDYDPLPVVDRRGRRARCPMLHCCSRSSARNVCAGLREPPGPDPLAGADVVVRGRFENQRVAVVPMEGAAVAVVPGDDGLGHQVTLHLACQMPHMTRMMVAGRLRHRDGRAARDRTRTSAARSAPSTGRPRRSS